MCELTLKWVVPLPVRGVALQERPGRLSNGQGLGQPSTLCGERCGPVLECRWTPGSRRTAWSAGGGLWAARSVEAVVPVLTPTGMHLLQEGP